MLQEDNIAFIYDDTLEGLLTAIFIAYANKKTPSDIVSPKNFQARLGQEVQEITSDSSLALRVQRGIHRRCGPIVFEAIKNTSLSDDPAIGTIIYRFLRYALKKNSPQDCSSCPRKMKCGGLCTRNQNGGILSDVTHPAVAPFIAANRSVYNERHLIMQFLRFEQLEGNLWFAKCNPKASVVPLIMDWFAGRFNTQAFLIFDEIHHLAGVYEGKDWYLVKTDHLKLPHQTEDETLMQNAWKRFYKTIAVEARYNPELRQHFMPKRLWVNISEMQEDFHSKKSQKAMQKPSAETKLNKFESPKQTKGLPTHKGVTQANGGAPALMKGQQN